MQYSQLIQLYFERSVALQSYWTLYVVVIGGLLAVSNLRVRRDRLTVLLVTVLFICFASKNLGAIEETTRQRSATVDLIQHCPDPGGARAVLEPTLVQPAYEGIRNFHVTCDVLTIAMLWAMERRRAKFTREMVVGNT